MTPLAIDFNSDGFAFHQVDRQGKFALYRKTKGTVESYEVVIIQKRPAHTWPDGRVTEAHEAMPPSESWGVYGWSYADLASGRARLADLMANSGKNRVRKDYSAPKTQGRAMLKRIRPSVEGVRS